MIEKAVPLASGEFNADPSDAQAYNNRGIVKEKLGDVEGARADFTRALELEPGMTQAEENLKLLRED